MSIFPFLDEERAAEQLAEIRAHVVEKFSEAYGITEFTCDQCSAVRTCEYAFDPYNTDGDCLAEK